MKKRFTLLLVGIFLLLSVISCGKEPIDTTPKPASVVDETQTAVAYVSDLCSGKFSKFDLTVNGTPTGRVSFTEGGPTAEGPFLTVSGHTVTVTGGGCYELTGSCGNGQVIVAAPKTEKVHLILNGLSLSCEDSAPLWIKTAEKVTVTLGAGTDNRLSDGSTLGDGEDAPKACLYSKEDLTINGDGKLTVNASVNNGIGCTDDLKITGGTVTVTAAKNGIKGNDCVAILRGVISVTAGKDAIKSDTEDDPAKGFVYIAGGTFSLTAGDDGIQAYSAVELAGGSFTFACVGKKINALDGKYHKAEGVTFQ